MLFSAFLIFLVFSTFSNPIILNRLGAISIIFSLLLIYSSVDVVAFTPGISLYNNWFYVSTYNIPLIFAILCLIVTLLVYSSSKTRYDLSSPFFTLLVLCNIFGLLLFPLVNDLIMLYVVIELQSYSLYLLTGLHNRSFNASRASLLYFLTGGIASAIILLSSYFIYALTGTTNLSDISVLYSFSDITDYSFDYFDILLIALLFKMGMAPLHRWSISVYNYAPTYITAYISIVAKVSILSWIFANANLFHHHILILFFYISIFVAAYKPLFQVNIKTILAYSGILNFGYLLLTVVSFDSSFFIYIIQYSLTHVVLFLGILAAGQYINTPVSKWSPLLYLHQLKLPNTALAFSLVVALFSLIGIPPLPGFYAKYFVLSGALQDNYVLESCAIVLCSVFATYFYANIIKILITSENNTKLTSFINPSLAYSIATCTVLLISFFVFIPALSEGLFLITL